MNFVADDVLRDLVVLFRVSRTVLEWINANL